MSYEDELVARVLCRAQLQHVVSKELSAQHLAINFAPHVLQRCKRVHVAITAAVRDHKLTRYIIRKAHTKETVATIHALAVTHLVACEKLAPSRRQRQQRALICVRMRSQDRVLGRTVGGVRSRVSEARYIIVEHDVELLRGGVRVLGPRRVLVQGLEHLAPGAWESAQVKGGQRRRARDEAVVERLLMRGLDAKRGVERAHGRLEEAKLQVGGAQDVVHIWVVGLPLGLFQHRGTTLRRQAQRRVQTTAKGSVGTGSRGERTYMSALSAFPSASSNSNRFNSSAAFCAYRDAACAGCERIASARRALSAWYSRSASSR